VGVPLAIVLGFSLWKWSKPNWTGPVWLGALPLLAMSIRRSATWSRRWGATLSIVLCVLAGLLYYFAVQPPGSWFPDRLRTPVGWRAMSAEVARIEADLERPVVVGLDRYFIASELAYFDPDRDVAGRHLVGAPSLMWSFWSDPAAYAGRTMVLVGLEAYEFDQLEPYFAELGPVQQRSLGKEGRFYFRIGRGYRPPD